MKKIAAILLLSLLVFNFYGYRWLLSYMEKNATARLEQKLDAGAFEESELIEVKIPIRLPYHASWSNYETFYGETEWNGEYFRYVKRKLVNDTLYLLCIPHAEKNRILAVKNDFFKSTNNLPFENGPQKSPQPTLIKLLLSEFLPDNQYPDFAFTENKNAIFRSDGSAFITQFNPSAPAQPPETTL